MQTTTEKVCDENLDTYEPVSVSRTTEDGTPVGPNNLWRPSNPPTEDNPYSGSHLSVRFTPRAEVTSVTILKDNESREVLKVAFRVKPREGDELVPLPRSDGSDIFYRQPGLEIRLPPNTPYVVEIEIYIVDPLGNESFIVLFNGCEHVGKCEEFMVSYVTIRDVFAVKLFCMR